MTIHQPFGSTLVWVTQDNGVYEPYKLTSIGLFKYHVIRIWLSIDPYSFIVIKTKQRNGKIGNILKQIKDFLLHICQFVYHTILLILTGNMNQSQKSL